MASHVSIPTTARLPGSLRLEPSHPVVAKLIGRLSRASLLTLAVQWLNDIDGPLLSSPYLRPPRRRTGRFRRRSGRSSDGSGGGSGDANETILDDSDEQNDDDDDDDEGSMYPASRTIDDLREVYAQLQAGNTRGSRRELADRILEGDWRRGLTLHQLAMADLQYLHDHPLSQRWSAFRVVSLKLRPENPAQENDEEPLLEVDGASLVVPRIHPPSFLRSLQGSLPPDVKTHCAFERHRDLPVLLLRIFIFDTPYATELAAGGRGRRGKRKRRRGGGDDGDNSQANAGADASMPPNNFDTARTVYVAFPDASAHVYVSAATTTSTSTTTTSSANAGGGDTKSLRSLVVEGIPKALSRPGERYALRPTSLSTRNMAELVDRRGGGRGGSGSAGGGWGSVYGDEKIRESPLDSALPTPPLSSVVSEDERNTASKEGAARVKSRGAVAALSAEERAAKRRRLLARARFGTSGLVDDGLGVERVDVAIEDPFPQPSSAAAASAETRRRPRNAGRGKQAGGRRSTLEAALEREAALLGESDRDDDDGGDGEEQVSGEDDDATAVQSRSKSRWRPSVKLTFRGSHVFAGIRQLVEAGAIDGERIPGWMTGEEGVTIGAVRHGRIRGHKGSGL
ncbi:hypothetical protein RB595_004127 [Gaeumannomyces hyphopodioides]